MEMIFSMSSCVLIFILNFNKNIMQSFLKFFSLIWFLILFFYLISQNIFGGISKELDFTFLIFIYGVSLTYIIFYSIFTSIPMIKFKKIISTNIIYLSSAILFAFSLTKFIYYLSSSGGLSQFREIFIANELSLNVGMSFPICACAFLCAKEENIKIYIYAFSLMMLVLSLISTSKIFIVISLIYISGIYNKKFKFKFKFFIVYFVLGVFLFSLTHILLDKLAGGGNILYSLYFTFFGYLLGGFAVFQNVLDGLILEKYNSFWELIIRNKNDVFNQLDNGWIKTGDWLGNVYSGFTPWYNTFGNYGILLIAVLIGIVYALIYSQSNKESLPFIYLKAFSIYPLVFFVFSDTFFASKLMWLAFIICAITLSLTKIKNMKKHEN